MSLQARITALAEAIGADIKSILAALAGKASLGGNAYAGDQDLGGNRLLGIKVAALGAEHDAGSSGATPAIDFANGSLQRLTLTANASATLTFPGPGTYTLRLIQDATGNRTFANPVGTKAVGAAVSIKLTAGGETFLIYKYNGTTVYCMTGQVQ